MINAVFRPLEQWPGKPTPLCARKTGANFRATQLRRLDLLRSDLGGAYKAAAIKLHPDKVGHDELFKQLQEHLRILRRERA